MYENRIEVNPQILLGKPVIKGTRIPVYLVLDLLAEGKTFDEILKAYPDLKKEDIYAALHFAGEKVHGLPFAVHRRRGYKKWCLTLKN